MKTKHAQRKAEKRKVTRSIKLDAAKTRDMVVRGLKQEVKRDFRRWKKNHAGKVEIISHIKKLESQVNQIFS
tara:strand:- start:16231 stop:16446 length:216 start_codon:yes stop_codon:yes gene_type:complete